MAAGGHIVHPLDKHTHPFKPVQDAVAFDVWGLDFGLFLDLFRGKAGPDVLRRFLEGDEGEVLVAFVVCLGPDDRHHLDRVKFVRACVQAQGAQFLVDVSIV